MSIRNGISKRKILVLGTVLIFSTLVLAHGNEQHVMGTVTKIDERSISVKTKTGEIKTLMVMPNTKFVKGEIAITQKDLKVGDRVVIHAARVGDTLHATEVKVGNTALPDHQH